MILHMIWGATSPFKKSTTMSSKAYFSIIYQHFASKKQHSQMNYNPDEYFSFCPDLQPNNYFVEGQITINEGTKKLCIYIYNRAE